MIEQKNILNRPIALLLASSLCATAALSARAAAPIDSTAPALPLPEPSSPPLIAAAGAPASASVPAPAADAAQPAPIASASASSTQRTTPSQNVTINLINRLVQRGVLSKEDAADLIKQAEADAIEARAQADQAKAAVEKVAAVQAATASGQVAPAPLFPDGPLPLGATESGPAPDDSVRVTYIPEAVKAQIRDELRQEVMDQARDEHWAAPRMFPDWVTRIKLFGDIRVRYEGDWFPSGNDNTGSFPNFNAINTGAPYDISGTQFAPELNVDKDRNRIRIRARFGADVDFGDGFTGGFRIGTGENNNPVTESQSLGVANNGQGGNFSRYQIWLDRAFIKYELGARPDRDLSITIGRFDNPFFHTSMIWADDLGFDGAVIQGKYQVAKGVTPFLVAGAFPVFNTDFNFSNTQPAKFSSTDKWLYGTQIGTDLRITKDLSAKLAASYYYFQNIEGKLSDPFTPLTSSDQGNTDDTRPAFAQKGNTYMALRDIVPTVANNFGTIDQYQYYGLATPFRELAFTGRINYDRFEPFRLALTGEWVKNLAFDYNAVDAKAVNNRGASTASNPLGAFAGGDTAWIVDFKVGSIALEKRWDWNLGVNYRYVESDSVVDGFCDADFGLGGTNLKGYTIYGEVAISPRVSFGLRWMSAQQVSGPPFKSDILQVDFNGKF